jgi:hypothetical protein
MKALFCNKCHKRIIPPKSLLGGINNIKGNITIKCSDIKCKGNFKLKNIK